MACSTAGPLGAAIRYERIEMYDYHGTIIPWWTRDLMVREYPGSEDSFTPLRGTPN